MAFISDGKTSTDSYLVSQEGYDTIPLLTIGDEIPLLEGEFPFLQTDPAGAFPVSGLNQSPLDGDSPLKPSDTETYVLPGRLDGVQHVFIDGVNYVFVNHNLSQTTTTELNDGQLTGSRVSLLAFDKNWDIIGGRNLIDIVRIASVDGTDALRNTINPATGNLFVGSVFAEYILNPETGIYEQNLEAGNDSFIVGNSAFLALESDVAGLTWQERLEQSFDDSFTFNSLSSLSIAESGFRLPGGQALPYVFNGERDGDGIAYFHIGNGTTAPILGLGAFPKSQVYSPLDFRQEADANGTPIGETIVLGLEAFGDGEIYLFEGNQFPGNADGFADTEDALYVLRVKDNDGNVLEDETLTEGTTFTVEWVLVDGDPLDNPNAVPDGKAINTLNAGALSDWVNGSDEGVLRSTNFENLGGLAEDPNNTGTFYFTTSSGEGKLYRLTFGDNPTGEGTVELLLEGGEDNGGSYDSVTVDKNGNVLLQDNQGGTFVYEIASDSLITISKTNEAVIDPNGNITWQSEGITEINHNFNGTGLSAYLSSVDALSFGVITDKGGNLATGGQLLLTIPTAPSRFDTDIYRFQNRGIPGSYIYAGAEERDLINSNFSDTYLEEGLAFKAASAQKDNLIDLYRFRSNHGTYLLVGETERNQILNDPNFSGEYTEEGRAFSVYDAGSGEGTDFHRLRRLDTPGAYIYVAGDELDNIQKNLSDLYAYEGHAFEAQTEADMIF